MTNKPWLDEAIRLEKKGIVEVPGAGNNPDIMFMAKTMKVWYPGDSTAWCGLFVGYSTRMLKDKQPSNILGAKNWRSYGTEVQPSALSAGDILVFWRGTPKGPNGHVGFYIEETPTAYKVLGGNQGNQVSYAWVAKNRLLTARRPSGYAGTGPVVSNTGSTGTLSTNER